MSNLARIEKETFDAFVFSVNYDQVISLGETLSTVTLLAAKISDDTDISATVLDSTTASLVTGTATGGSTVTLIDTATNFETQGVKIGMRIYNATQKWAAVVTKISSTTNIGDTVHFDTQDSAAASNDVYEFRIAKASLKAGTSGENFTVRFRATTSSGQQFQDTVTIMVEDT